MTREQLHKNFKVEMDKNATNIAFGSYPAFLPEEIDHWLNQALFLELATKFTGHNFSQVPFEQSVKRIHDLEKLVLTDLDVTASLQTGTNRVYVSNLLCSNPVIKEPESGEEVIADDTTEDETTDENTIRRMFFVNAAIKWSEQSSSANTKNSSTNAIWFKSPVKMVDHITANRFLETYNNKPWIDTPVATIENNTLYIYVDTYTMKNTYNVDITYIKYPTLVENLTDDVDELPEYMWYEVVNRAVALALENIESQRVQTKSQLNQTNE